MLRSVAAVIRPPSGISRGKTMNLAPTHTEYHEAYRLFLYPGMDLHRGDGGNCLGERLEVARARSGHFNGYRAYSL